MIKAWYGPDDDDLTEQMLEKLPPHKRDDQHRFSIMEALVCLRALGYSILIEVEVHGDMAKALQSLGGNVGDYVVSGRPVRQVET